MNTTANANVGLHIESMPELYHGKATGKTVWHAETKWPVGNRHSEVAKATLSVLGRGYTRAEAVADWTRRAQLDGYHVTGVDLDAPADHTPAMALRPWRVVPALDGLTFEVWTQEDNTPGSRNNFAVASGIQDERDARVIAAVPELLTELRDITGFLTKFGTSSDRAAFCRAALSYIVGANGAITKAEKGGAS